MTQFFSLLMEVRIALNMPVLVARGMDGIHGAVMGYTTARPEWPKAPHRKEWSRFEEAIPGVSGARGAVR